MMEHELTVMTDSEIKDLLGYSNTDCRVVRFKRTNDGYKTEENKNITIQHICENAHFINGDHGAIIYMD